MHAYACVCVHARVHVQVCVCVCVHVQEDVYLCVCVCRRMYVSCIMYVCVMYVCAVGLAWCDVPPMCVCAAVPVQLLLEHPAGHQWGLDQAQFRLLLVSAATRLMGGGGYYS